MDSTEQPNTRSWPACLDALALRVSAICCGVIAVMVTGGIIGRGFGYPLMFADEYSSYLMAACAFLALPAVTSSGEHLVADFLLTRFGAAGQVRLRMLADAVLLVFVLSLLAVAVRVVWVSFEDGLRSQGLMSTPLWVPQSAMLVGLLLCSVSATVRFAGAIRNVARLPSAG